ncbi:MAG: RHS repeat protein [Sandaracinaceae bacterium]|nr:RHS repeat protein [Sandaracinaceae bacterium]
MLVDLAMLLRQPAATDLVPRHGPTAPLAARGRLAERVDALQLLCADDPTEALSGERPLLLFDGLLEPVHEPFEVAAEQARQLRWWGEHQLSLETGRSVRGAGPREGRFGTTLAFGYDGAGRMITRTGSDGSSRSYSYAPGNRLDTITDATGTTTYHYDAAGRMSGLDYPSQLGFERQWDPSDRIEAVRVHADPAVDARVFESTYTYDEAGNLESVTDPFGRTTTYTYDALNRLATETRPNGVTSTHTYDGRGWVTSIVHADAGGTVIASVAYLRSPSGEPTRITREDGSYVLVDYDPALRVERERYFDASDVLEEELAYTYDADGNRTSRTQALGGGPGVTETYVYGPGSELLRVEVGGVPTQEFTYDAGGRVTRIVRDGRDLTFTYDADDHVVAIDEAGTGETTRFAFDAEGRRTGRQVFAGAVLLSAMAFATAPGLASGLDSPHLSDDGAGGAAAGYVYVGEHALARFDAGSTEPVYYLRDAMGSVIGLVDQSGSSTGRVHYDGFGNERRSDGGLAGLPAEGGPRFQGMWEDGGLYYVRARLYDPASGRFLAAEPARIQRLDPARTSTYLLGRNNPFMSRDPDGRFAAALFVPALLNVGFRIQESTAKRALFIAFVASVALAAGVLDADEASELSFSDIPRALSLLVFNRTRDVRRACRQLGLDSAQCRRAIHSVKDSAGLGGADDIEIDTVTGDVFDAETGEWIGNILDED